MHIRFGWRAGLGALAVFSMALALTFVGPGGAWAAQGGGKPGGEAAGNNLSFPVIWSEGVTKVLRGTFGEVALDGGFWYWWGTDADGNPESCEADSIDTDYCADGRTPCEDMLDPDCRVVYPQQDSLNTWQAQSADGSALPVNVHWIDWGDNLESVDWYTRSQVRAEVVLIQDLGDAPMLPPMLQYDMTHLSGLGIDEVWGLTTDGVDHVNPVVTPLNGTQATVYSHCARLVIQKLTKTRDDPTLSVAWDPNSNTWTGDTLAALFNKVVWEGGDGPGYYSAEINVKGKVIYGYTWNVRRLNDGAGDYRITFNLDDECPAPAGLNTFFLDGTTQIVPISEEEVTTEEADDGGDTGGAVAYIDYANNLTYMDVRILERGGKVKTK